MTEGPVGTLRRGRLGVRRSACSGHGEEKAALGLRLVRPFLVALERTRRTQAEDVGVDADAGKRVERREPLLAVLPGVITNMP